MTSFLKYKHQPIILEDVFYDFIMSLPESTGIQRNINVPRIHVYDLDMYVYSIDLFHTIFHVLAAFESSTISNSPIVFKKTVLTETILTTMTEGGRLKWGLFYKDRNVSNENLKEEVSLKNLKGLSKYATKYQVELSRSLSIYMNFIENEKKYLKDVEYSLRHSSSDKTDKMPLEKDEWDKDQNILLPRDGDLQRAKNIQETINKGKYKDNDDIHYDDYWQ